MKELATTALAAIDNDIIYKGAWLGLLGELIAAIPSMPTQTLVLGQAKFVVSKKLQRDRKKKALDTTEAERHFREIITSLQESEPTSEELAFAAELEVAALNHSLEFDTGESLLCAMVIFRGVHRMATGDKRAIAALESLVQLPGAPQARNLCGRVLCLEQLIARVLSTCEPARIREAVCVNAHVDRALAICFSCASPEVTSDRWTEGLTSYIESVRQAAPSMLCETIPQEDSVRRP